MLITFASSLDPDQARQNVWPDLDTSMVILKEFFEKVDFEKNQQTTKKDVCVDCLHPSQQISVMSGQVFLC